VSAPAYFCPGCLAAIYVQTPVPEDERRPCPDCMPLFQRSPGANARELVELVTPGPDAMLLRIEGPELRRVGALARAVARQLARPTCHRGHDGYPLDLWDCPECVERERRMVAVLVAAVGELKTASSAGEQAAKWRGVLRALADLRGIR
jgi:hypothetical protein